MTRAKLVLASTKDHAHRIYLPTASTPRSRSPTATPVAAAGLDLSRLSPGRLPGVFHPLPRSAAAGVRGKIDDVRRGFVESLEPPHQHRIADTRYEKHLFLGPGWHRRRRPQRRGARLLGSPALGRQRFSRVRRHKNARQCAASRADRPPRGHSRDDLPLRQHGKRSQAAARLCHSQRRRRPADDQLRLTYLQVHRGRMDGKLVEPGASIVVPAHSKSEIRLEWAAKVPPGQFRHGAEH